MKSFFVALMVAVVGVGPAAADNKIVLESYTGGKTATVAKQVEPLLQALSVKGFAGGYDAVGRPYESRVSRPAIADGLPADFAQQVDAAQQAFFAGKFQDAANALVPLIDIAQRNGGAFASNKAALGPLETALVVLALSQERMGDYGVAQQTFAEFLRTFPDKTIARGTYGGEAGAAFDKAKKALAPFGRGKLLVKSSVDTGVIFINERIEQAGTVSKEDLPVGDYRVFVQLPGKQLTRQHRVTVRKNETAVLNIDAELDVIVQTSKTWTGLAFTSAADREKYELEAASQFANGIDADAVVVVGIDQVRGKPAVIGILVNRKKGNEIRRASVQLDPVPTTDLLQSLASFVVGEMSSPPAGVDVSTVAAPIGHVGGGGGGDDRSGGGAWGGWKWITGGLGVVALGVGGYLVATDGDCKTTPPTGVTCPDVYNNAVPGYLSVGGGVVLTGLSIYLFARGGGSSKSRTAYVVPTDRGAFAGFSARF